MQQWDAVVVGAGLAGLETGALLAARGRRVLVLERRPVPGGRAMVVRHHGFTLNYGYHYVLNSDDSPHFRVMQHIGARPQLVPTVNDEYGRFKGGRLHRLPTTRWHGLTSTVLSWRSKAILGAVHLRLMAARPDHLWHQPLGPWLRTLCRDEAVVGFLLDMAAPLLFEAEPERLSAGHFVRVYRDVMRRMGRPPAHVGPWDEFYRACVEAIEAAGGRVQCRTTVTGLLLEEGRVAGVRAGGNEWRAPAVVLAVPPQQIPAALAEPAGLADRFARWAALEPTAGLVLDLGVAGALKRRPDSAPGVAARLGAVDGSDWCIGMACHTVWVPRLAPPGHSLLQLIRFLTPAQAADAEAVEAAKAQLFQAAEAVWPGCTQRVVLKRWIVARMLTAARRLPHQAHPDLLPLHFPDLPGLYCVGEATQAEGELSNAGAASALAVAEMILGGAGGRA